MQVAVRNTFINVEEEENEFFRSISEGHSPQKVIGSSGTDHERSDAPDWLIPTPELSPIQSPRGGAPLQPLPSLLSAYLMQEDVQQAYCTEIEWPQRRNVTPSQAQWCQDMPMMTCAAPVMSKCMPAASYMPAALAVPYAQLAVHVRAFQPAPAVIQVSRAISDVNNTRGYQNRFGKCEDVGTFNVQLHAQIPRTPAISKLPFGNLHRFHDETHSYGYLSDDCRQFTKTKFGGRLSVITEDKVHTSGVHTYLVQFSQGELSSADGLGFVFSPKLPCPKNIQRIVSIFVNSAGRICMRAQSQVMRSDVGVKPLELGDWITLTVDLQERVAIFTVYPKAGGQPSSATFAFGESLADAAYMLPRMPSTAAGHFAFVVKNRGVSVTVNS